MDMNTIKALQAANAGILLTLTREPVRAIFEQWTLYANFEIVGANAKKIVPAKLPVFQSRYKSTIESKLADSGLSYIVVDLVGDRQTNDPSRSASDGCQRSCTICGKTDFDDAKGCANPSVFSFGVGDWVCNLETAFEVRS
jgi:hypothetical protein